MLFTKKLRANFIPPTINNFEFTCVKNIIKKATRVFFACKRLFGITWGHNPKMFMWLCTSVIRIIITITAIIWLAKLIEKVLQKI